MYGGGSSALGSYQSQRKLFEAAGTPSSIQKPQSIRISMYRPVMGVGVSHLRYSNGDGQQQMRIEQGDYALNPMHHLSPTNITDHPTVGVGESGGGW